MQVYELMQRIGTRETNLVIAYIKDAFRAIQEISRENIAYTYIDIVNGVEDYHFPTDKVKLISLKIDTDIADASSYYWEDYGRFFKLWKRDYSGELIAPDSNEVNGVFLEYTSVGMVFVHNLEGDSDYYSELASGESQALTQDTSIVFLDVNTGASSGASPGALVVTDYYSYLKGDVATNGSVRIGVSDGTPVLEKRVSGVWVELQAWDV